MLENKKKDNNNNVIGTGGKKSIFYSSTFSIGAQIVYFKYSMNK